MIYKKQYEHKLVITNTDNTVERNPLKVIFTRGQHSKVDTLDKK